MEPLWRALGICPGDVVAFVGAGGKTSLALACLRELAAAGRRALFTTTTRILPPPDLPLVLAGEHPEPAPVPADRVGAATDAAAAASTPAEPAAEPAPRDQAARAPAAWAAAARAHLDAGRPCCVAARRLPDGKLAGLDAAALAALRRAAAPDVLLVEADGSAMLPLKAPAEHEPAIPESATLVVAVAGLGALGRPVAPGRVHRPERLQALAAAAGLDAAAVTPALLAAALTDPGLGCARRRPAGARLALVLNQADLAPPAAAAAAAEAALAGGARRIVLTCLQEPEPVRAVTGAAAGLLLAAGSAARFGAPKQLALLRGEPLVVHALRALCGAGLAPLLAVTGAQAAALAPVLEAWPVQVVHNTAHAAGMSTSLAAGLQALLAPRPGDPAGWPRPAAALAMLADMPNLTAAVIDRLVDVHLAAGAPATAPVVAGERRNPVLLGRALWPELLAVSGDEGGRSVLRRHAAAVQLVPFDDPALFLDVDTPADLPEG